MGIFAAFVWDDWMAMFGTSTKCRCQSCLPGGCEVMKEVKCRDLPIPAGRRGGQVEVLGVGGGVGGRRGFWAGVGAGAGAGGRRQELGPFSPTVRRG